MNEILKIVLSLSLSGSLLFFLLLLCKPLIKNRISKRWQYYIWLVVIARLLLPFSPETSLVGTLFEEIDRSVIVQSDAASPAGQGIAPMPQPENGTAINGDSTTQGGESVKSVTPPQAFLAYILQNLWLVWLVVALILLIRKMTIYQGFVRYIKAGRAEVSDTAILDRLALIGEQAGVKTPVELYTNGLIASPLLLGFFRPCIVLPTVDLPDSDLRYILLHELTHYKRRDMFYKWLVQLTTCLHWFNPFVYWMGQEISRTCELACDEAVIKSLSPSGQREYGDTLLNAFGSGGSYRDAIASVTLNESKELLKERLSAIMKFATPSKLMKFTTVFLTLILCLGAMFTGAYAIAPNSMPRQVNAQAASSDRITPKQADEMALALTNEMWVWNWVEFFVPYMSEDGVSQIVSASESSEWAGTLDYSTMAAMKPFSQTQVDSARNLKPEKEYLTRADIDAHAQMIMQSNGQWKCVDFMFPYMTDNGIKQIQQIYAGKHGGQTPAISIDPQSDVIKIASNGQQNIAKSSSFEAKENQLLILTIQSDITGGTADFFLFSPVGKEQRITIGGADKTEIITLTAGRWAYNCTGFFTSGEITILGELKNNGQPPNTSSSVTNSTDEKALELMQKTGNWGYIETYLPQMSRAGIDAVVNCYNGKHPNPNEHKMASNYYN